MKKIITCCLLLAIGMCCATQVAGQIKGLFDKEEPEFFTSVLPASENGTVQLVFYFTHSKINSIEASIWLKDQGTSLTGSGNNKLIRGLQETGNRQQDTVTIRGLNSGHFYTFGLDYKTSTLVSTKFESKVLIGSYRYEFIPVDKPSPPVTQTDMTAKSGVAPQTKGNGINPCLNPDLYVQVEPNGFCGAEDRPAIIVQCTNCQVANWEFSVELRNANSLENWQPLRADGKMQPASGNAPRTEPFCAVRPGVYYVRVIAKGENCVNPVIHTVGTAVGVADHSVVSESSSNPNQIIPNSSQKPMTQMLPDTCQVTAHATLYGNTVRGTVELAANSPCGAYHPFTEVHYVHPGYRDIAAPPVQLIPGSVSPFEITLDERDLNRNIQTIQVVNYIQPNQTSTPIATGAFWIKTSNPGEIVAKGVDSQNLTASKDNTPPITFGNQENFDTPSITQDIETINVKASDPNCTPIQDLSLVYLSGQPDKPLYISWMNPRCCQTEGCKYSVWAGDTPDRLRILVEASKRGAIIKELLPEMLPTDKYIEIVVNTANGNRKAAYVLGEGPKYGIEEIMAYRDRLNPQKGDALTIEKTTNSKTGEVSGDLVARGIPNGTSFTYVKPQNPIEDYQPCKYQRETMMVGDKPAVIGKKLMIQYDFTDNDYRYTLYLQPEGSNEWFIAPGTEELQRDPRFDLEITPQHAGKYVVLARKANSNWGCLASPLDKALEVKVVPQ